MTVIMFEGKPLEHFLSSCFNDSFLIENIVLNSYLLTYASMNFI